MAAKRPADPILLVGYAANCPDMEYASGFRAVDPVVLLQRPRARWLVVPRLEYGRALREVKPHTNVLTPELLKLTPARRRKLGEWAVAVARHADCHRVVVPPSFPHGVAMRLKRAGIVVRIAKESLFPQRAIKTSEEIRRIKEAQQAAVIAMRSAISLIASASIDHSGILRVRREPLTSETVRRTISRVLFEHNCTGKETIVAAGMQGADPHETGSGPLPAHEPIVMDIFPQHMEHGYWGDLTRTVVRGKPGTAVRRMYSAVKAAHAAALSHVRAGVNTGTVHRAARSELDRRGFATERRDGRPVGFIHSTGHGVGLAIHEAPSVAPAGGRLRSGHVITIEPGLYYPELGGIRVEDTVVVTPHGWRYLVPCEKRFEV